MGEKMGTEEFKATGYRKFLRAHFLWTDPAWDEVQQDLQKSLVTT